MVRFSWVLLYSSGLNVYVGRSLPLLLHTYWDWVSMLMLMLLERSIYLFRICFPHVIAFYFIFHARKGKLRDRA